MCTFYTARVAAAAAILTVTFAAEPASAQDRDELIKRLQTGEVVIEQARLDQAGGSAKVDVLIDAPARVIWEVITSCESAMHYLDGMEGCEILYDDESETLTRHVVDSGWLGPKIDYQFKTFKQPYRRLNIELFKGNLDRMEGYWEFEEVEGLILLTHLVQIKPKIPVPRWLVRSKLNRQLPAMMACIRALSGGSLSEEGYSADLEECPGKESGREGPRD